MMAFSYQEHHPFLLDSFYLPKSPVEMLLIPQHVGEMTNASSSFPYPYSPEGSPMAAAATDAGACDGCRNTLDTCRNSASVDSHIVCSPMALQSHDDVENVLKRQGCMENKRKISRDESKDIKKGRSKKQKRNRSGLKETEEKKPKTDEVKGSKACWDPPAGYVHVRASRGQATDSHSLAERVRREKISERMKMLQGLVPGCENVTGKALMLDEIINYVQSLQNQVEFLSMQIASLSPILYDFNVDFDDCINQLPQFQKVMRSIPPPVSSVDQTNQLQAKAFDNGSATDYQMMDHHSAPPLLQVQGPTTFSLQDGGSALQVGAQRQGFLDQLGFINMCSFQ